MWPSWYCLGGSIPNRNSTKILKEWSTVLKTSDSGQIRMIIPHQRRVVWDMQCDCRTVWTCLPARIGKYVWHLVHNKVPALLRYLSLWCSLCALRILISVINCLCMMSNPSYSDFHLVNAITTAGSDSGEGWMSINLSAYINYDWQVCATN